MIKIREPNASLLDYLATSVATNIKEWLLRVSSNKSRFILIIGVGSLLGFLSKWWGIAYLLVIVSLIALDFIIEAYQFVRMGILHRKQHPKGITIELDAEGFRKSSTNIQWHKVAWDNISIAFDHKKIRSIAAYQPSTKEYHIFFGRKMTQSDYSKLRQAIAQNVRRIY